MGGKNNGVSGHVEIMCKQCLSQYDLPYIQLELSHNQLISAECVLMAHEMWLKAHTKLIVGPIEKL